MPLPRTITHLLPTGAIVMYSGSDIPSGYLLCNGASVSRSDYPDLAEALGETGTTFSLPDYRDRVPQGAGTVSPNVGIHAGVPNFSGWFNAVTMASGKWIIGTYGGLFDAENGTSETDRVLPYEDVAEPITHEYVTLIGSRSNSLFGWSDTVQPPAVTAHFLIKA